MTDTRTREGIADSNRRMMYSVTRHTLSKARNPRTVPTDTGKAAMYAQQNARATRGRPGASRVTGIVRRAVAGACEGGGAGHTSGPITGARYGLFAWIRRTPSPRQLRLAAVGGGLPPPVTAGGVTPRLGLACSVQGSRSSRFRRAVRFPRNTLIDFTISLHSSCLHDDHAPFRSRFARERERACNRAREALAAAVGSCTRPGRGVCWRPREDSNLRPSD